MSLVFGIVFRDRRGRGNGGEGDGETGQLSPKFMTPAGAGRKTCLCAHFIDVNVGRLSHVAYAK